MRRKPLFPPPHNAAGKRLANKGRQSSSVLTINGRVKLLRRWWHGPQEGSVVPADVILNAQAETVTPGVREMACRQNYHLSEHDTRRSVYGAESAEGEAWVGHVLHAFKHGGYDTAWEYLMQWRTKLPRSPKKRQVADPLLHYVSERREMILYPEFRSKGWQIGSGPTESQRKLSVDRLKGRGRRWDRPNGVAVTALDNL